jgi:starch phosphorylase
MAAQRTQDERDRQGPGCEIAYFTMEVALRDDIPTFSGGLGVLAGDYLKSASDAAAGLVAVTLLHRQGYLRQELDAGGAQVATPVEWRPEDVLEALDVRTTIKIGEHSVVVTAWKTVVEGVDGGALAVLFLDTDLPVNQPSDRQLSGRLYGGDEEFRLRQEAVLGIGGIRILRTLGYDSIATYHMNEGHSSLLTLALIEEHAEQRAAETGHTVDPIPARWIEEVRDKCVFTTHTPVPAGHDRFAASLVTDVLGTERLRRLEEMGCIVDGELNMSWLGMRMSRTSNAVSRRHREVAQTMFPTVPMTSVTNGVHAGTWVSEPFRALFDRSVPGWRSDNDLLRYVSQVELPAIAEAHESAKGNLLDEIARRTDRKLDPGALIIGLARRVTPYKQPMLVFSDLERLVTAATAIGPVHVVCAGKAHPRDEGGKDLVMQLAQVCSALRGPVEAVFLENYDLGLAGTICAGSDIWLNNPRKPNEASGTSGMKAALNGVPSLSVLDGWWLEGCVDGVTGWAIGNGDAVDDDNAASNLYEKLEQVVLPLFYRSPERLVEMRRNAIALNGSFFNTERMLREYYAEVYTHP